MISHRSAPGGWLPHWTLPTLILLSLVSVCSVLPAQAYAQSPESTRSFRAEGSDLLMGVGPGGIALGGAVVAGTGDVYSIYWNPAGLVEAEGVQFAVARQLNAQLIDVNFAGLVVGTEGMHLGGIRAAVGLSWMTRLHVKARGAFGPDDLETVFLQFTLPGLPDSFDGAIESKTRDYRLSLALTPVSNPRWSLGATVGRVDCRTDFCGVTANDPGNYTVASTNARAVAVNLGGKLFLTPELVLGVNFKDLNTRLKVDVTLTDQGGTSTERFISKFPKDLTLGLLWKRSEALGLELDYQSLFGEYGSSELSFRMLRAGVEKRHRALSYSIGLLVPLKIESESTGDVRKDMPLPFALTLGAGWRPGPLTVELALYAHPVMSYGRDRLYPAADLSVGYRFHAPHPGPNS